MNEPVATPTHVRLVRAWQATQPSLRRDALEFWQQQRALPSEVAPEERAKELCMMAYAGDRPIGITTAYVARLPALRCNFAFLRSLVAPEHRRHEVARQLTIASRQTLSRWARERPELGVQGMAAIVQSPALVPAAAYPVWPPTGLTLVGYTEEGFQVRVVWFKHAKLAGIHGMAGDGLPDAAGGRKA